MSITGSCLCGDVAFEVDGDVQPLLQCHCSICRKVHGAPFASYAGAPKAAFRWLRGSDAIRRYRSSPHGERPFCPRCGSKLPVHPSGMDMVLIPAGLLQGVQELGPMPHLFVGSKAPWYEISDSAPRFEAFPPGWGQPVEFARKTEPTDEAVRGGCLCGAVAYEIRRPIAGSIVFCHCSRCRRARSAAHNANFFVEPSQFRWLHGHERAQTFRPPDAQRFAQAFCGDCGSAVPHAGPLRVVIPAATLDDDPGIRPGMHIFVSAKAPWFAINDQLPRYDDYPPAAPPAIAPR